MAFEVTEGVLAGSTAVEVCSGLTGAPALEADEKGVASRVRRVLDPCDTHHCFLTATKSGTETKVTNSFSLR